MEMHTRASLLAVHGFYGSKRSTSGIGAWLSGFAIRLREAARRRSDRALLLERTDRELSDIGLTRGNVLDAARYGRRLTHRSEG
jgi:uncharacterized protein YjiS (DUF1127 family)